MEYFHNMTVGVVEPSLHAVVASVLRTTHDLDAILFQDIGGRKHIFHFKGKMMSQSWSWGVTRSISGRGGIRMLLN